MTTTRAVDTKIHQGSCGLGLQQARSASTTASARRWSCRRTSTACRRREANALREDRRPGRTTPSRAQEARSARRRKRQAARPKRTTARCTRPSSMRSAAKAGAGRIASPTGTGRMRQPTASAADARRAWLPRAVCSAACSGTRKPEVRDVHRRAAAQQLDRAAARLPHAVAGPALWRRRRGRKRSSRTTTSNERGTAIAIGVEFAGRFQSRHRTDASVRDASAGCRCRRPRETMTDHANELTSCVAR